MRKLIAGLFYSVDGVAEAPDQFQFDSFDEELSALMDQTISSIDTVLMGRVGFEQWASYWPNASQDLDFAEFINGVPKYVASETLTPPLAWSNAELIEGDLLDFVRRLKNQPGGDIAAMGGLSLVRQLLLAGLMDELVLIMHPVIAGKGRHLFGPDDPTTRLELKNMERTSKGNAILTYSRRAD
ncbi:dihydrofolate reductase family protein [Devosia sp. 1566]|uniref:dihydrofolate reductase family protein n=1 Tax=Devosia sp. 1566 TaxID=2499144 RepID=UPI000FDB6FD0|nr:dihydrofolate reductase family protein [Devosia sp. 1566]